MSAIPKRRPWAWSQISADPAAVDLPQHLGAYCERREHRGCPQLPGPEIGEPGTCGCVCHRVGQMVLDLQGALA